MCVCLSVCVCIFAVKLIIFCLQTYLSWVEIRVKNDRKSSSKALTFIFGQIVEHKNTFVDSWNLVSEIKQKKKTAFVQAEGKLNEKSFCYLGRHQVCSFYVSTRFNEIVRHTKESWTQWKPIEEEISHMNTHTRTLGSIHSMIIPFFKPRDY